MFASQDSAITQTLCPEWCKHLHTALQNYCAPIGHHRHSRATLVFFLQPLCPIVYDFFLPKFSIQVVANRPFCHIHQSQTLLGFIAAKHLLQFPVYNKKTCLDIPLAVISPHVCLAWCVCGGLGWGMQLFLESHLCKLKQKWFIIK